MSTTNQIATKCPYCGSSSIKQTDGLTNKLLAKGVAYGFKQLTGLRASSSNAEASMTRNYKCNNCQRTWLGDGRNPTGLPEDDYFFQKTVSEICNGFYSFSTNDEVMRFSWKMDAYIHNITSNEEITGYKIDEEFDASEENKAKFLFLKSFAILIYVINIRDKIIASNDYQQYLNLNMACEAGMTTCRYVNNSHSIPDNILCFNILYYIKLVTLFDIKESEKKEALADCSIDNTNDYIFSVDYWNSVIDWLKKI